MRVGVIGLGYVGSVAAAGFASAGHDVLGVDNDWGRVEGFRRGVVPFYEPDLSALIGQQMRGGALRFLHVDEVAEPLGEAAIIAAGTPSAEGGMADLSQVRAAIEWASTRLLPGSVVVMKSTIPPGSGRRLWESMLSDASLHYVSNPEFLREGQAVKDWFHPDRIVIGGADDGAIRTTEALYDTIDAPVVVTDTTSAEMIKYAANAFLATRISFINEVASLCSRLDASVDDVRRGISLDERIGAHFLQPGVGYGGSCFPKDVRALDHLALTIGHQMELLRSVITVNNRQRLLPLFALRECFGQLPGVEVAVLGLAFKPQTDDVREAPALDLIRILLGEGGCVRGYDPRAVPAAKGVLPANVELFDDLRRCVDGAQAVVLMTEWPEIVEAKWEELARCTRPPHLLFDGRNALDHERMRRCGFHYLGVGRPRPANARAPSRNGLEAAVRG